MTPLDLWQTLMTDAQRDLRDAAAACDPTDVAAVARLRKHRDADLVRIALDLAAARRKAANKFPGKTEHLIADSEGVEQATSQRVADHKAKRFAGMNVADLCCGIGGDAMSLQPAVAVDFDPLRAWMAGCNAGCQTQVADVTLWQPRGDAFHIDPSRRQHGRRTHDLDDYQPNLDALMQLLDRCAHGAIKLGPGADLDRIAHLGEIELVSEAGSLTQAVLWTGNLAHDTSRRATLLPQNVTLAGEPCEPDIDDPMRYLFTVDPAVERAGLLGLLGLLGLPAIHPALGALTSNNLEDSPWLTPFELIERLPYRPRKLKQWLKAHDGGTVEIKTRGRAVDPDAVQRDLRGDGATTYTIFILRFGKQIDALITRRV